MNNKEKYKLYLKSNHWNKLRFKAWTTYGYRCFFHKNRTNYVEVHHIRYNRWENCTVRDVVPLCKECHDNAHKSESWLRATCRAVDQYWEQKETKGQKLSKKPQGASIVPQKTKISKSEKKANRQDARRKRLVNHARALKGLPERYIGY